MMRHYAVIGPGNRVLRQINVDDPDDAEPSVPVAEHPCRLLAAPIDWSLGTATKELRWPDEDAAPAWVEVATLAQMRAAKIEAMSSACREHIIAGFMCSALGAPYLYPAKPQDQSNLVASVTDSLLAGGDPEWMTPFWCASEAGAWEFRLHTITQIQQVGRAGKAATLAAMAKNEGLRQQIEAASADQLDAINW